MSDVSVSAGPPLAAEIRATVRLQFHEDFTLWNAVPLVSYFAQLGISHIYASPLLAASTGSRHGYDVVDPTRVNPELGGEEGLQRLVTELRRHSMGLILDVVSNHMAVGGHQNPWWLSVMEWGQASPFARCFDIDWQRADPLLYGKVLVPFLGRGYGDALAKGEIALHFNSKNGRLYVAHHDHHLPLYPPSYAEVLALSANTHLCDMAQEFAQLRDSNDPIASARRLQSALAGLCETSDTRASLMACLAAFDVDAEEGPTRLHRLLERQHFRLASWRTAADDINWRRFFDINELGGLRVEDAQVFEVTHAKTFELVRRGWVDGLRIDHIDGLAQPRMYCRKLRRRLAQMTGTGSFPIYVEKILADSEQLPDDWQVDGSTGYEFMNQVSLLQHAPEGEAPLRTWWNSVSGRPADFRSELYPARKLLLATSLAADLSYVARGLLQIARADLRTRDMTLGSISRALTELVAHFPVYRTYVGACGRNAEDERFFDFALDAASRTLGQADWPALSSLNRWLGADALRDIPVGPDRQLRRQVLSRFQQLTAPAAAKAVEDTAFYRAGVLLSRYDVGFDAENFSAPVADFHQQCQQRARLFPYTLLTTATHDSKRGEDVRARLAVLSERAPWFVEQCQHWLALASPLRRKLYDGVAPSPGDEVIAYQTLLGSWPLELNDVDDGQSPAIQAYLQRLLEWQQKALREAKLRSSWHAVNRDYERACAEFLTRLLSAPEGRELRTSVAAAVASIAPGGALNSLTQTMLRMTTPGVPDLYQGNEFWDFNLVDPDNRRPVDFAVRGQALQQTARIENLLETWHNGHIKQRLIQLVLEVRNAHPALFLHGSYVPLQVQGKHAARIIAFARKLGNTQAIVVAPIHCAPLTQHHRPMVNPETWRDTRVVLPDTLHTDALHSVMTPQLFHPSHSASGTVAVSEVLGRSPVNLLLSAPPPNREMSL